MSVQMTVRIPDHLAKYIDEHVAAGDAPSRAALIAEVLEERLRRERAEHDARIYAAMAAKGERDEELDAWTEYAGRTPLNID